MKDTAVKFLIDEISCRFKISEELRIAMYKAIKMEKEEIENAFNYGQFDLGMEADEYYNQTFKSE
jgi:hypothetical protein